MSAIQVRGMKPTPGVDPKLTEIDKFYEFPAVKAELKRTDANTAVLLQWLAGQNVEVYAHTLAAAYTVCKPQLEMIPPPPPKRLPNIGADSGGAPSGRKNHAAPETENANRVSTGTIWDALREKARKRRANAEAAKKAEDKRLAESEEARRAKIPPPLPQR
jgi:hypothetical protein